MTLKTIVCIKQVPDPQFFSQIKLDPLRQTIQREGIPAIINPLDRHAIEEALRTREEFGGEVIAITMGPPAARTALEDSLAMGADSAILLTDKAFAGADSLATAYCLACAIQKLEPFSLVLCGNESIDSSTGQVAPQIAEFLNLPHATAVKQIVHESADRFTIIQSIERGSMKIRVSLPAVLAVSGELNQPRLPTILSIMGVRKKPLLCWGLADIDADANRLGIAGSPTQVTGISQHEVKRQREILTGDPELIAQQAVKRIEELLKK